TNFDEGVFGGTGRTILIAAGANFTVSSGLASIAAGTSASGGNVSLGGFSKQSNSGSVTVKAAAGGTNSGALAIGNINVAGAGGTCDGCGGIGGGSISITTSGDTTTGFLRAYGGGGAGGFGTGSTGQAGASGGAG